MNIPERATKEQIDTMTDTEGNIRVSSVPGSGKTFVLTYRMSFPKTFTILDKKAELDMIKNVAEDMGISLKDNTAKKITSDIDMSKQDMSYVELMSGIDKTELKRKASNEKNEDVRIRWQEKCQYVFKIDNITQTYEIQFRNIRGTRRIMFRAELEKVSQPD